MESKIIIDIENLSVSYGQNNALIDISCQIESGDFIGLVGPNGSGKSTLSKAILGLISNYSGKIKLFNQSSKNFKDWQKIGYLPQKHTDLNPLFPATTEEIIALGLLTKKSFPKKISKADWQKVEKILAQLEITDLKGKILPELSGGQQQKVLLARALISEPELLILDEPSTALDPIARDQFFAYLQFLNKEKNTTIILITHDTGYIGKYANKLLYLDHKLIFFGKITDFCPNEEITSCFQKSKDHIIWHQH